jgi:lysophospholipase L1-like esterase
MRGRTESLRSLAVATAVFSLAACLPAANIAPPAEESGWSAAWTSPPSPFLPGGHDAYLEPFTDVTVRQLARIDAGGTAVRVRFTNELGRDALHIDAASLARVSAGTASTTPIALTFGGKAAVRVPPGATMWSDPLRLSLARFDDLAISTYFSEPTKPTGHRHRVQLLSGDATRLAVAPAAEPVRGASAISAIEIHGPAPPRVLVAFGDSITEGAGATPQAHMSWPAQLSRRLARHDWPDEWSVVNAGISGNRLLHDGGSQNGLARFARDALAVAGVTDIVVLEGVNDLGVAYSPSGPRDRVRAEDLILAYRQMIDAAQVRGARIYGATILPYKDPARLRPDYHIGDSLHPNDAGYAAMAQAVVGFLASGRSHLRGTG